MRNKNRIYFLFLLFLNLISLISCGQNQISVAHLKLEELPKELIYKGKVKEALRWTDEIGDNIVLITETGEYSDKNGDGDYRSAELYAYHFLIKRDSIQQYWKVYDFIKECPVDIKANFVKNVLQITDLNNNGIGEVWLMYKVVCHGDVSPSEMKVIMYERQQKSAMRGRSKVKLSENEYEGGEYKFDAAFLKRSENFRKFAVRLWNENLIETW